MCDHRTDATGFLDDSDPYTYTDKAEVPFERLRVGDGYDILKGHAVPSACVPFQLPADQAPQNFEFNSITVETAHDIERVVNLSSSISASAFKIGVDVAASYLQSVTYSDTSLTTLIRARRVCPDIVYASKPRLTVEAEQILARGASHFFEEYGQYFVCGHRSQVSLVATLTHTATSREHLRQFKSKLGANFQVTSVQMTAELVEKATSSDIVTTIEVYTEGYSGPSSAKPLTTQDLVSVLGNFLDNRDEHKPVPRVALLEHYCWIDPRLKMLDHLRVPSIYDKALVKCLALEVRCRSSALRCVREMQPRVASQRRRVIGIKFSKRNRESELRDWMCGALALEAELEKYTTLESLLNRPQSSEWAQGHTEQRSKTWVGNTENLYWNAGVDPLTIDSRVEQMVQYDVKSFEKAETPWRPVCQYERLRHEFRNRTIIGARLENCWKSHTNASWKLLDGWPGKSYMEVEFCTQHYRGGHWRFEVWSVDNDLCHR